MPAWQATSIGDVRDPHSRGGRQHHQRSEAPADAQPPDRRGDHAGRRAARRRRSAGAQFRATAVGRPRLLGATPCRPSASRCRTRDTARPLQRQAFVETLLARAAANPERRIRRRHLRLAALELPLRHFDVDSRRRHAVGRRAGSADAAGAAGDAGLFQDDGHSDREGPRLHGRRSHGIATGGDAESDRRGAGVARSGCDRSSPRDRHAVGHGRRARRRHGDRHCRRRARLRSGRAVCRRRCTWRTRSGPTTR